MIIPMVNLSRQYESIKDDIDSAIQSVVDSQYFILGSLVEEFEKRAARFCEVKHAVGVSSGTAALIMALKSLGIGPGDEVITVSWTYIATARAIKEVGATPVLIDIDPRTFNMAPNKIPGAITDNTKAIIPVHFYGQCADMDAINDIAKTYGLYVIEDAAQAFGAGYKGGRAGSFSDIGCVSFYPSKNLGCYGDGGMCLTNDDVLYDELLSYRTMPVGCNDRLDAIQAAILMAKLPYLDEWNNKRIAIAQMYTDSLKGCRVPFVEQFNKHIYYQYVVGFRDKQERDTVQRYLNSEGIESRTYYPIPVHKYAGYEFHNDLHFTEAAADCSLALPIVPELFDNEVAYIVKHFNKITGYEGNEIADESTI